jgi:hypothetical protein
VGGNLNAQTLFANQDIHLFARGTFALSGQASGVHISAVSSDIDIAAGAQLGVRGTTNQLTLFNGNSSRETFIGGTAHTTGYSLDSAEIARLHSDVGITLGIAPTLVIGASHVTIGSFALSYGTGANIGSKGTLAILTPGEVSIVGDVALTTSDAADQFVIDPTRVELNSDTGSIAMLDAGGNRLGRLQVTGNTIAVATGATLDQIRSMSDVTSISALLDVAGGKANPLRAGTVAFNVVDGLFIQNSGISPAFRNRRGFAANALDITTASAATQIAINGVIFENGVPVTGLATTPLITINGQAAASGGEFDPRSTVNGCIIGSTCDVLGPPPNDDLKPPVTPDNPSAGGISSALVQLEDNQPLISPPLVDEPITGVGNDDLWLLQCDPKKEGCPQQDKAQ